MASFQERVVGAVQAQASTFAEVQKDPAALTQAVIVVAAAGLAAGLGNLFRFGLLGGPIILLTSPIFYLIGWGIGSAVLWVVGTKAITGTKTGVDVQQVLRVMGFAWAPGLANIVAIIPYLGPLLRFIVAIYSIYVALVATKELFGYPDFIKAFVALLITGVVIFCVFAMLAVFGIAGAFGARMF